MHSSLFSFRLAYGLGALALLGVAAVRPAAAQSVQDGSFETPVVSGFAYAPATPALPSRRSLAFPVQELRPAGPPSTTAPRPMAIKWPLSRTSA